MVAVNLFAAASDEEARFLFTSLEQAFVNLRRGVPGPLPPPVSSLEGMISPMEQAMIERALGYSLVGSPATIAEGLKQVLDETQADELIFTAQIHDQDARKRSFEILAELRVDWGKNRVYA